MVRQHTHTTSNVRRSGDPCDCSPRVMSAVTPPPLRSPHALCSSVAAGDFGTAWRATLRTREVALLERAAGVPARAVSPGVLAFLTDRLRDDAELCQVLGAAGVQIPTAPQTIARETAVRSLFVDRGAFVLSFTYDAALSRALRGWPERHYDPRRRAWLLPATRDVAHRLRVLLKGRGFHVTPDAAELGRATAARRRACAVAAPGGPRRRRRADGALGRAAAAAGGLAARRRAHGGRCALRRARAAAGDVDRRARRHRGRYAAARAARGRRGPRHGRGAAGRAAGARHGRDPGARARRAVGRVVFGSQAHAF